MWVLEFNLGPLEAQSLLVTAEALLQPYLFFRQVLTLSPDWFQIYFVIQSGFKSQ